MLCELVYPETTLHKKKSPTAELYVLSPSIHPIIYLSIQPSIYSLSPSSNDYSADDISCSFSYGNAYPERRTLLILRLLIIVSPTLPNGNSFSTSSSFRSYLYTSMIHLYLLYLLYLVTLQLSLLGGIMKMLFSCGIPSFVSFYLDPSII